MCKSVKVLFLSFVISMCMVGCAADGSDEEIKIESLGYDDLVSIDNWRKYDDR